VIKAAVLHFALGFVHPFVDGNGRTARAVFYWYMLKRDYWLFEYMPISRVLVRSPAKYAQAYLYTETDSGDVTYFVHFHLRVILEAERSFREYMLAEQKALKEATLLLDAFPGLNLRQRAMIHGVLKQPTTKTTVRSHQGKFHVTYPTARADLLGLVKAGFLKMLKTGKTAVFYPADDLRKRLRLRIGEKEKVRQSIAVTKTLPSGNAIPNDVVERPERGLFD
jgi:Fic family protein